MNSKLLAFLEDLVSQERIIKFNENKYHENDISESLKAENERKIRLCDEVLNEITKLQNIGEISKWIEDLKNFLKIMMIIF